MRSAVIFTLFVFIFCVAAESGPRIVTSRTVLNHELIIGRDTIVNVEIFNVGDETAYNVEYKELSNLESFEAVLGPHSASWSKLAPNAKISHNYVVRPTEEGVYVIGDAQISYRSQSGVTPFTVKTTDKIERPVIKFSEYERILGAHLGTWGIFTALALVPVAFSFVSWYNYSSSFVNGIKKGSPVYNAINDQSSKKPKKK